MNADIGMSTQTNFLSVFLKRRYMTNNINEKIIHCRMKKFPTSNEFNNKFGIAINLGKIK